jgi:hypothetical protein
MAQREFLTNVNINNLEEKDSIEKSNMSVRSTNALRRTGIHTIGDLLNYDTEKLKEIKNLGTKSIHEINSFLVLADYIMKNNLSIDTVDWSEVKPPPVFRDADGILREDITLEELGLSYRSYECLRKSGYHFASQIADVAEEELKSIKNLGMKSVKEILETIKALSFQEVQESLSDMKNLSCKTFVSEISKILEIHSGKLYQELLPIFQLGEEGGNNIDLKEVFAIKYLRDAVKKKILNSISSSLFGVAQVEIALLFPNNMIEDGILVEIIEEMEEEKQIILVGSRVECCRMTVIEFANTIANGRNKEALLLRLQGKTLEEIGGLYGITRERIRQINKKCLGHKPVLSEDRYIKIYEKYEFSKEDFILSFGVCETVYNYLNIICDKGGTLPIEQLVDDNSFPLEIRRGAEKVAFKNYLFIGNERVYKSRANIANYILRTYFQEEALFDEFVEKYTEVIDQLGLSTDEKYILNPRTYINRLSDLDHVLWKQGRRFRYYDIESFDFSDFWQELELEQYHDVELSALKFFTEHPELMHQYDIRDEYELHNLLKKLCKKVSEVNIIFGRMPMIEFGNVDRDEQILDMLLQLSPITAQDFASAYQSEYGVQGNTILANFLKSFGEYFHDGVYDISTPPLPYEQFVKMSIMLTEDYYEICDVKNLYRQEFQDEPVKNINPHTLKTLGFNVNVSYAVKKTFLSARDYFYFLLTTEDYVDTREFPHGVTGKGSYQAELSALRRRYEIIEYEPYCYVNIRQLNHMGVTTKEIEEYCSAVADYVNQGAYFTIHYLNINGFVSDLDYLQFDDVFYGSLITEDARFSYQRLGGTKLFRKGDYDVRMKDFLEYIVKREKVIGIHDMIKLISNQYGINCDSHRLMEVIRNSSLHYDSVEEKVYCSYLSYFEVVHKGRIG